MALGQWWFKVRAGILYLFIHVCCSLRVVAGAAWWAEGLSVSLLVGPEGGCPQRLLQALVRLGSAPARGRLVLRRVLLAGC